MLKKYWKMHLEKDKEQNKEFALNRGVKEMNKKEFDLVEKDKELKDQMNLHKELALDNEQQKNDDSTGI